MTATTSFALAFLALTPPALAAADVSFFVGPPGGVGRVEIHDESGAGSPVTPPELANVRLLALDFVGRTRIGEFLPWKPRLRSDVAGAARLELQGGLGSLYRYERALPTGGAAFGFFVIGSDGAARPRDTRALGPPPGARLHTRQPCLRSIHGGERVRNPPDSIRRVMID